MAQSSCISASAMDEADLFFGPGSTVAFPAGWVLATILEDVIRYVMEMKENGSNVLDVIDNVSSHTGFAAATVDMVQVITRQLAI